MACAFPITINVDKDKYLVPCRNCLSCRSTYVNTIKFGVDCELYDVYRSGRGASFVTFTYNEYGLPLNDDMRPTLRKRDLQLFMKRSRRSLEYNKVPYSSYKYIATGEYGDSFGRPHYHVIFLGLSSEMVNSFVKRHWRYGSIDVGTLKPGGVRYVLKYAFKQLRSQSAVELYDNNNIERPFIVKSRNLGMDYLTRNLDILTENNFCYLKDGQYVPIPKFYRDKLDVYKQFDSLPALKPMYSNYISSDSSRDFLDYQSLLNYNKECMLCDDMRRKHIPYDDSNIVRSAVFYK